MSHNEWPLILILTNDPLIKLWGNILYKSIPAMKYHRFNVKIIFPGEYELNNDNFEQCRVDQFIYLPGRPYFEILLETHLVYSTIQPNDLQIKYKHVRLVYKTNPISPRFPVHLKTPQTHLLNEMFNICY